MNWKHIVYLSAFILSACQSSIHQTDRSSLNETAAFIHDTCMQCTESQGNVFYLSEINGSKTDNSSTYLERGFYLGAWTYREVPTQELQLQLTYNLIISNEETGVTRQSTMTYDLSFTPNKGQHYFVRGEIDGDSAALWLEDLAGQQVSEKLYRGENTYRREDLSKEPQAIQSALAKITPYDYFNQLSYGESEALVLNKLGPANSVELSSDGLLEFPTIKTLHYENYGELTFHGPYYGHFYLNSKKAFEQ